MMTSNSDDDFTRPEQLSDDDMPFDLAMEDNPDLRLKLGRYLGGVRKLKKISQDEAARSLGLSRPHLSNIEQGRSRTGWKSIRAMARYYGYGIRALIEEASAATLPELTPDAIHGDDALRHSARGGAAHDQPAGLSDDEAFIVGLFRTLSVEDRKFIAKQILQLVQARTNRIGGS